MEYYLEELNEIIEELDDEDAGWVEGWVDEQGNDFSVL